MGRWLRDEEEQGQHAGAEDGQVLDDVEVGEHAGLAVHLVIDEGLGCVCASTGEGVATCAASAAARFTTTDVQPGTMPPPDAPPHSAMTRELLRDSRRRRPSA